MCYVKHFSHFPYKELEHSSYNVNKSFAQIPYDKGIVASGSCRSVEKFEYFFAVYTSHVFSIQLVSNRIAIPDVQTRVRRNVDSNSNLCARRIWIFFSYRRRSCDAVLSRVLARPGCNRGHATAFESHSNSATSPPAICIVSDFHS